MINPDHLPESTRLLFNELKNEKYMERFTLVGGPALSLQLGHRQSEDLDFIFDGEKIDHTGIRRFISRKYPDHRLMREEKGFQLDFFIREVKLTFFSTGAVVVPFPVKEHAVNFGSLQIAPVEILACLKMAIISQRCTMRDYYDLYYIAKHVMPLADIFILTRQLVPNLSPITYSETLLYTRDIPEESISSHLAPVEEVTKEEIAAYFTGEIRKMKNLTSVKNIVSAA